MKRTLAFALLLAAILVAGTGRAAADNTIKRRTFNNPVINNSTPDPSIIRAEDGFFYLYGTEDWRNMPIYRSKDLVDWVYVGTAFSENTRPASVRPGTGGAPNLSASMWAPDINYINGQYVLYFSIGVWDYPNLCGVGVATADAPEGPFVDRGVVLMADEMGVPVSIDQFFIQDNGRNYMVWGSYHGIYMIELTADGLRRMPGAQKIQLAANQLEASYIHKRNGYYYLIGSTGSCCVGANSTYRLIYGRATSLAGPYVTKSGKRMLDGAGDLLLEGNDFVAGPGHNAEFVEDDNGDTWVPYHGYVRNNPDNGRVVFIDKVQWKDDWPYMDKSCPSREADAPYFKQK